MEQKPRSIELVQFQEELLPSGRKLLHCIFKDKFGERIYRWVPPWKGDYGVLGLLSKAWNTEEWNDPEGAWANELKQAAEEIPPLEDLKLPVRIRLGPMMETPEKEGVHGRVYSIAIDILGDEASVRLDEGKTGPLVCVGDVSMSWIELSDLLWMESPVHTFNADKPERILVCNDIGDVLAEGVRIWVWLACGQDVQYDMVGRETAWNIRSFIRRRLSDYRALKKGFEEV